MWILFAFGSALFAGLTSVLAKCGIKKTDSDAATAIRTIVVLIFSWLMVWIVGSAPTITGLSAKTWIFLILSGIATGASWLCYFRALRLGDVNKVVPIDKSSTILTIILALIFLGEPISWLKAAAVILIGIGTFMMIEKKADTEQKQEKKSLSQWTPEEIVDWKLNDLHKRLQKIERQDEEKPKIGRIQRLVPQKKTWYDRNKSRIWCITRSRNMELKELYHIILEECGRYYNVDGAVDEYRRENGRTMVYPMDIVEEYRELQDIADQVLDYFER